MAREWCTATVAELQRDGILLVEDGNHGEYRPRRDEFVDSGVAFIRAADMDAGRVLFESAARINERARQRIRKGIGAPGDVLLSHKGTVGKVALVRDDAPPFVCSPQTTFWRTCDERRVDRRYLYAFLRSPAFRNQLATRAGETDMAPYVSLTSQRGLSVMLPPLPEQHAIAHILGTLDDKIELNRRMNETLEAMARALFKSWFVDFDPVRAKAESRDPGLPQPLADLFPDSFEDSELGEIPKGWLVERLSDVMTFEGGSQPPAREFISEPREGYVRLIQIRDFYSSNHITFVPDTSKLRKFATDDIMIARYGSSGNAEKASDSLARICRGLSGAYNVALVKVIPHRPIREFLGHFLKSPAFQAVIKGMGARSVQSGFRKNDLNAISIVSAPNVVHVVFERFADRVWQRTYTTNNLSRSLAELRDTLLPKLISGELRVKDAERIVKDRITSTLDS